MKIGIKICISYLFAMSLSEQDIDLLTKSDVRHFLSEALLKKYTTLKIAEKLSKKYTVEERKTILDYYALLPKLFEKFFSQKYASFAEFSKNPVFLLGDSFSYEQSTASDLSLFKCNLWNSLENGSYIDDLCCGMGGDSFFLPQHFKVRGIDLNTSRIAMYKENAKVLSLERTVLNADVRDVTPINNDNSIEKKHYFTIDPARRTTLDENQRNVMNITPSLAEVLEISKKYNGAMIKLPPAYPTAQFPKDSMVLYLGSRSDCRECLLLLGDLAKEPGIVKAIMVNKDGSIMASFSGSFLETTATSNKDSEKDLPGLKRSFRTSTSQNELPIGALNKFLIEPIPLLIRSHLFGIVAKKENPCVHLISEGIAYATSDTPFSNDAFKNFEVLNFCPLESGCVRHMLQTHNVKKIVLKVRGVKVIPEEEIKRLRLKGKQGIDAVLFYTRIKGEKSAILTKALN